jgi:hypothetical protein
MWRYSQTSGELCHNDEHIAYGFSGSRQGKNDPNFQSYHFGPIPVGRYTIGRADNTGIMQLQPAAENEMFGRSNFIVIPSLNKDVKTGFIVLADFARKKVNDSQDRDLLVIR